MTTLIAKLSEIREACAAASSPEDVNINLIIIEIDRLAMACIDAIGTK